MNGNNLVGKCDKRITDKIANKPLNEGVRWDPYDDDDLGSVDLPSKVFNIFNGAVYEATLTPGVNTYHGYPWRGRKPGNRLPEHVKRELLERAEATGCRREIERWISRNSI